MAKREKKGFTLVELLLYVSVSAIMLLSISVFLGILLQSRIKNQTIAEVEQQGLYAMQLMIQTIRNADAIIAPNPGLSDSTISLNTPVPSNNPTVFAVSSGAINITEGVNPLTALTNDRVLVSALNFQNTSINGTAGIVRISFIVTHKNPVNRSEYEFSKTFVTSAALRK